MNHDFHSTGKDRIDEGFPNQRLTVLPHTVLERCRILPMVKYLHVTHLGIFPSAPHHYVERKTGVSQAILIYCLEGRGFLELENSCFSIQPGYVAVIPPGTPHIYRADTAEPWSIFWIHFDGVQTDAALASIGVDRQKPLLYVPDFTIMRRAFEEVYACLNYHYSDAGLLAMTSELMRLLSRIKLHYSHPQQERQASEDRIIETIAFMERHLDLSISLEELARRAGLSVPHYSKRFKERTNQSPTACFIQLKIRKACDLLYQTDMSIKEIAEQLGYEDPYYFSRIFKKVQGVSPSTHRKNIGN